MQRPSQDCQVNTRETFRVPKETPISHDVNFSKNFKHIRLSKILIFAYLDIMGEHGEVHAAPGGEAEAGHGVDSLVAPDPEPAPAPELSPPTPGLSDQVEAGDGDQAGHQQLGQPEVGSGAVVDVEPAGHVQVRPAHQKKFYDSGRFVKFPQI